MVHSLGISRNGKSQRQRWCFCPMLGTGSMRRLRAVGDAERPTDSVSDIANLVRGDRAGTKTVMEMQHWAQGRPRLLKRAHRPSAGLSAGAGGSGRFDGHVTTAQKLGNGFTFRPQAATCCHRKQAACTDRTGQPCGSNNPDPASERLASRGGAVHARC